VRSRTILVILLAAAGMALGSHLFGWPSLVVLALGWGLALPALRIHSVWVGVAALLAWALLLALQVAFGGAAEVARLIGGILGVHGLVAMAATLLLAFVLGWSGAGVTSGVASLFRNPAQRSE
jgi:hypothetical protein